MRVSSNGACEAASVRINKRLDVTFPGDKNDNNEYSDESEFDVTVFWFARSTGLQVSGFGLS